MRPAPGLICFKTVATRNYLQFGGKIEETPYDFARCDACIPQVQAQNWKVAHDVYRRLWSKKSFLATNAIVPVARPLRVCEVAVKNFAAVETVTRRLSSVNAKRLRNIDLTWRLIESSSFLRGMLNQFSPVVCKSQEVFTSLPR